MLLRKATEYGDVGDWDSAVTCLRDAFCRMDGPEMDVKIALGLPLCLQKAGRNDEAWSEFNRLTVETMQSSIFLRMNLHIIWDKMRLFLQREGRYEYAVSFAVVSYLSWMKGLQENSALKSFS